MTVGLDQQVGNVYEQPQGKSSSPITSAIGTGAIAGVGVTGYNYFKNNPLKGANADEFVRNAANGVNYNAFYQNAVNSQNTLQQALTSAITNGNFDSKIYDDAVTEAGKKGITLPKSADITAKLGADLTSDNAGKKIAEIVSSTNDALTTKYSSASVAQKAADGLKTQSDEITDVLKKTTLTAEDLTQYAKTIGVENVDDAIKNIAPDQQKAVIENLITGRQISINAEKTAIENLITNGKKGGVTQLDDVWDGTKKVFKDLGDKPLDSVKQYADDIKGAIKKVNWKNAGKAGLIAGGIAAGAALLWNTVTGKKD